jgi:hypothetical protein
MMSRGTRWLVAALIASAVSTMGCTRPPFTRDKLDPSHAVPRRPIVADESLAQAFDTSLEMRLVDTLERDNFLRDREIRLQVVDGVVNVSGEVWTPLERERAAELIRNVAGVIDVVNELDIRPPG